MVFAFVKRVRLWAVLAGVGSLALTALPAHAQYAQVPGPWCPTPGFTPLGPLTSAPAAMPPAMPPAGAPTTTPSTSQTPQTPQTPPQTPSQTPTQTPSETTGQTTPQTNQDLASETGGTAPSSEAGGAALGAGTFSATGYIDNAIPFTHFRLRFDAAYGDNRPDRAEFFYPECGCNNGGHGPGPNKPETSVDYQDISSYLEIALNNRFSGFVEVPVRFLNPEQNDNATGLGDMNAGAKFAVIATEDTYLTGQLRVYFPTGDASRGLGNSHTALEPGVLGHTQMDRLALDAELRDWIPLNTGNEFMGNQFAGNVLRYGVGVSYLALNNPRFRVIPVVEFVGWTVLSGQETEIASAGAANLLLMGASPDGLAAVRDASGDTIVNAKVGVRFGFGDLQETGFLSGSDLYVGYGRALTGDVWYKDILRVEYRLRF
jgi:hypothetical protein